MASERRRLFLVGAPKSGTTAMFQYLADHPRVFAPWHKEPHFFAADHPGYQLVRDRSEYQALYSSAAPEERVLLDGSVYYLSSSVALPRIRECVPDALLVVMLRNPVDLALALHREACFGFEEDERSFERAWRLVEERRRGRRLPPRCREPKGIDYAWVPALGRQVRSLRALFPERQVLYVFFDDFVEDPGAAYRRVLDFAGLMDDGKRDFPILNPSREHRFPRLSAFVMSRQWIVRPLKRVGFAPVLKRLGSTPRARPAASSETRRMLAAHFARDVEILEEELGRDLSAWKAERSLGSEGT